MPRLAACAADHDNAPGRDVRTGPICLLDTIALTFTDNLKRVFPFLLLFAYGIFMCGYFIFQDYSDHYRFFARYVFPLGLFVLAPGLKGLWQQPLFQILLAYLGYLLLSALWSDPLDWYRLGQKFTISVYLLSFIAITRYLVQWNPDLYQRLLQLCAVVAGVAALTSLILFYQAHSFPGERLEGTGSLTNINEFSNVYGIFALLAMGFALQTRRVAHKILFLAAIGVFLSVAWFGQSRTAFVSMIITLLALTILTLPEKKGWYTALLAVLVGTLVLLFPDPVEQALLRGQGLRPQIWAGIWEQAWSAPIAGHGLIAEVSVKAGSLAFATAHNAYLQAFWHGGIIGLSLFLLLLGCAALKAWSWGRQRQEFSVFCMLVFTACAMMTGVDTLIERPRDQWMLFWFPLALLFSYPGMTRSRPPAQTEIPN